MTSRSSRAERLLTRLHRSNKRSVSKTDDPSFAQFLLTEYTNIAQAHFNTVDTLTNFVRYYLLIASVPVTIAAVVLSQVNLGSFIDLISMNPLLVTALLTTLSFVGLLVLGYVINLRCDAILYARTVNGIRKYFYERADVELEDEAQLRTLPKTTSIPAYAETDYFIFVVVMFATIGAAYFGIGLYVYWRANGWSIESSFWLWITTFILLHLCLYQVLARRRERSYLRGHIIGIDVDGVLNDHRKQFCTVLSDRVHKRLDPESITHIPVHEIPNIPITELDEHAVFNWPAYWSDMPAIEEEVGRVINKIRNLLGYKVWIFTHRGWPQPSTFPQGHESQYWAAWEKASRWALLDRLPGIRALDGWLSAHGIPGVIQGRALRSVTTRWLKRINLSYDKLIIERGNTYTTDPLFLTRNRFLISRERILRVFVEDDLLKARKLANICDLVFLIDQPYNQSGQTGLPRNLLRVRSWNDIYKELRRVF